MFSCIFSSCAQKRAEDILTTQNRIKTTTVLLNNSSSTIPIKNLEDCKIASIYGSSTLDSTLSRYASINRLRSSSFENDTTLTDYNTLLVQVNDELLSDTLLLKQLKNIPHSIQLIIAGFGSLNSLAKLNDITAPIVWSEDTSDYSKMLSAEIIFGGIATEGHLKETVSSNYQAGDGFSTDQIRLRYNIPEAVGIDGKKLTQEIDDIAKEMIEKKASPGAVVMIVKDYQVIFEKAYGTHYYDKKEPTNVTDIFDLASVSKITATTLAVMHLEEEGKINLEKTIGDYLEDARNTNKKDIKLRDVMLHQAGFISFIPFYRDLTEKDFRADSSAAFPVKVSENYFLKKDYFNNVMWPIMLKTSVKPVGTYVYSDISMYVMQRVIESITKKPLDEYVEEQFYNKLGMYSTGYNPRKKFPASRIVPTELDRTFRMSQLIGYVHDQGAAMAGGVAGHAGLFSTANDLAIYGQMLLNKGTYGDKEFFKPETVVRYTRKYGENSRRGLGFDRWDPDPRKEYPSKLASPATFGHTGYTGTCIWIDPEQQLVYIFLSNRVQPSVSPFLSKLDIRSRIMDAVYKAIPKK